MDYCMHAYGAKNSDRQIKNSPIPTENQFAKFNARQIFPLYGIYLSIIILEMSIIILFLFLCIECWCR